MRKLLLWAIVMAAPVCAEVKVTQGDNKVTVEIDGKPYTTLFYGPEAPKPYLHPLRAPSGLIVTRGFPMEKIAGESTDHQHHRGLWLGHFDVNGFDFWSNEFTYKTPNRGKLNLTKIDKAQSGKKSGEIDETSEWRQPDGKLLITENRKMVFYAGGPNRVIDFDITLTAGDTVKFGDNKDGVFALRVASGLEEAGPKSLKEPKRTGVMTNAEGMHGEEQCWGKRSNWMDYSGEVEGQKVGISIFDHPENPRHPTYWHSRGYGLFAANIFGVHEFTHGKEPDGSMTLQPGQKLRFRYRVVIHPGDLNDAHVADLYREYAAGKELLSKSY